MQFFIGFISLLATIAWWWFAVKRIRDAAVDVTNTVGRARTEGKRVEMRKRSALAPVTAIDDPVVAGATIMMSIIAEDMPVTPEHEDSIRFALGEIAPADKVDEAIHYAKWATGQVDDPEAVISSVAPRLKNWLSEAQRKDFVDMVRHGAVRDARPPLFGERVSRLMQKLGLSVAYN